MDRYKIKITRQAKEHLMLIREYVATELSEPARPCLSAPNTWIWTRDLAQTF